MLTTRVRPNLVVDGRYCICAITKTDPPEGIPARSWGSFNAAALCSAEDTDRFVAGGTFELRAGPQHILRRVFSGKSAPGKSITRRLEQHLTDAVGQLRNADLLDIVERVHVLDVVQDQPPVRRRVVEAVVLGKNPEEGARGYNVDVRFERA